MLPRPIALVTVTLSLFGPAASGAQPLGVYRWQLLPYCNVLTLNVSQQGSLYTLDGTDDRCGVAQAASARGLAFLNPNGTVGFGITMVQPGGTPVHLEATINVGSLNGTWRDSSGAAGNFVFTVGAGLAGPPRLVPPGGVPPGSITAIQLAVGAVGAGAVAADAIGGANVIDGSLTRADIADAPRIASIQGEDQVTVNAGTSKPVVELALVAPAAGRVIVNASGSFQFGSTAVSERARCTLTTGTATGVPFTAMAIESSAAQFFVVPFGGTRVFEVPAGSTTFRLVCDADAGNIVVNTAVLTALFVAGP